MLQKEISEVGRFLQFITIEILAIRHPPKWDLYWQVRNRCQCKSQEHKSDLLITIRLKLLSWVSVLFNSDCDQRYWNSLPVITPQLKFYRQSNQQTLLLVRAKVPFITITIRDCGLWWNCLCNLTQILIDLHNLATTEVRLGVYCWSQLSIFTELASFNSFFRILFPTVPPQINLFFCK